MPEANLERWMRAASIDVPVDTEIDALRNLREALARVFLAVAGTSTPSATDIDLIGSRAASAVSRRRLRFDATTAAATWVDVDHDLLDVLATDAAGILTNADTLRRMTACAECRWVFIDTTRNRSRRWCDPADCGNRARQRRHYHRSRG